MANFLDLPVEIRLQIYRYLIKSKCQILIPPSSFFPWFDHPGDHPASHGARLYLDDPSITQVSKQMRSEAQDILSKALHYELDIDHPNPGGSVEGLKNLFEVIHVAPGSTCTTQIRIKFTLALDTGTIASYTRTFEPREFKSDSWDPWLIANGCLLWMLTGDWEERTMGADAPASGNVTVMTGEAFLNRMNAYLKDTAGEHGLALLPLCL